MNRRTSIGAALILGLGLFTPSAHADCVPATNLGEDAVFAVHGCDTRWPEWMADVFNMDESEWRTRGYHDACNITREYAQHWNAAYLIARGTFFGRTSLLAQSFHHGEFDYLELPRGKDSFAWHDRLEHRAKDTVLSNSGEAVLAKFDYRPFATNILWSSCSIYAGVGSFGDGSVASRAGNFIHEGWHAWQEQHDLEATHNTKGFDYVYPHVKGLYRGGDLWEEKSGHGKSHSVFQIQLEFYCDLADSPGPATPFIARVAARLEAVKLATNSLLGPSVSDGVVTLGAGYTCGSPDLVASAVSPPDPEPDCTTCSVDSQCAADERCLVDARPGRPAVLCCIYDPR